MMTTANAFKQMKGLAACALLAIALVSVAAIPAYASEQSVRNVVPYASNAFEVLNSDSLGELAFSVQDVSLTDETETVTYTPSEPDANGWLLTYDLTKAVDAETGATTCTATWKGAAAAAGVTPGTVVVPSEIAYEGDSYTVTAVAKTAKKKPTATSKSLFAESNMVSVELPNTVTTLGDCAFAQCTTLESIILPDSLTSVGNYLFNNDTALAQVKTQSTRDQAGNTFPKADKTGQYCFNLCAALTNMTFQEGLTTVSNYSFTGCSNLASVQLPEGVEIIGMHSFKSTVLTSVTLPQSVQEVQSYAFEGCSQLASVTFNATEMYRIGAYAFNFCTALKSIEVPQLTDFTGTGAIGRTVFAADTALETVVFKTSANNINKGAAQYFYNATDYFNGCSSLKSVLFEGKKGSLKGSNVGTSEIGTSEGDKFSVYYTLYFYSSEDARVGLDPAKATIVLHVKSGTSVADILAGTAADDALYSEADKVALGRVKSFMAGFSDDFYSWSGMPSSDTLDNSYVLYPMTKDKLDAQSSIVIPDSHLTAGSQIENYRGQKHYEFHIATGGVGVSGLDDITAVNSSGNTVNQKYYTKVYEEEVHPVTITSTAAPNEGDTSTFTVTLSEDSEDQVKSIQWQSAPISSTPYGDTDDSDLVTWTDLEGETGLTCTQVNNDANKKLMYRAVVEFSDGLVTRSGITGISGEDAKSQERTTWKVLSGEPIEIGSYRVKAVATSENETSVKTGYATFTVVDIYTPEIVVNGGENGISTAANSESYAAMLANATKQEEADEPQASSCAVLVNSSNTLQLLVAAGVAGLGNGSISFVTSTSDSNYSTVCDEAGKIGNITAPGNGNVVPIGSESAVSDKLVTYLEGGTWENLKKQGNSSTVNRVMNRSTDSTTGALSGIAADAWSLASLSSSMGFNPTLQTPESAVLLSPNASYDVMVAAQLAYETGSLVLFCESDGTLSKATQGYLANLKHVYVAGSESYVSAATMAYVQEAAPNAEVQRVLDKGSAYDNALSLPALLANIQGKDVSDTQAFQDCLAHIHIVRASDASCVVAASEYAAVDDGMVVVVSSDAELRLFAKKLATLIQGTDGSNVKSIDFVGSFSQDDQDLFKNIWRDPSSVLNESTWNDGDVVEEQGSVYRISVDSEGNATAEWLRLADTGVSTASILPEARGVTVTGVVNEAKIAEALNLTTVTVGDGVNLYGIAQDFFDAAANLQSVYVATKEQKEDQLETLADRSFSIYVHPSHVMKEVAAKDATCTENGVKAHWTCTICGKAYSDENGVFEVSEQDFVITALGHDMVDYPAKEPTATEDGYTAYKQCSRCGFQNPAPIVRSATGEPAASESDNKGSDTSSDTSGTTNQNSKNSSSSSSKSSSSSSKSSSSSSKNNSSASGSTSASSDDDDNEDTAAVAGTDGNGSKGNGTPSASSGSDSASSVSGAESTNTSSMVPAEFDAWTEILVGIIVFLVLAAAIIAFRRLRRRDKIPLAA